MSRSGGLLLTFALASLAAVAVGALVCAQSGIPSGLWLRNLAAWAVGGVSALALTRWLPHRFIKFALWFAPGTLALTFLSPALDGVHRWIDVGPLHMNAAMLVLPVAVIALSMEARRGWALLAAAIGLGILVVQPDASQATALGAACVLTTPLGVRRPTLKFALIAATATLTALAWFRPDPLQPVPEVEDVIELAFRVSPAAAIAAIIAVLACVAAPVAMTFARSPQARLSGLALSLCFAAWAITPMLGAYPVPWVGIGLSPIIGAWLGVGVLSAQLAAKQ